MYDLNSICIVGRLTRTPELKTANTGTSFIQFVLANNSGNKEQDANFVDVVAFGKTAENCSQYLSKGSLISIQGRIQSSKWKTEEGEKRTSTQIVAMSVSFINSPKNKDSEKEEQEETQNINYPF